MHIRRFPFDPGLLEALLAAVEAGSVTDAARALHLTQPAVTARLRRLESAVGAALLVRSARGVEPTPAGRRLCERARDIQAMLEEAASAAGRSSAAAGRLPLAASTTVASYVLPPLLARFREANPRVAVSLWIGNTEEVLERVRSGRSPLGLVEGHARAPTLRLEAFLDDEIVAICAPGGLESARGARDLARMTLLWREAGSGTRAVVERALAKAGVRRRDLSSIVEIGGTEAIKSAAAAGLGVGFVSRWALRGDAPGRLRRLRVPGLSIRRKFYWAVSPSSGVGAAAAFRRFAQTHAPAPEA